MKFTLLAATALAIAMPAIAQDMAPSGAAAQTTTPPADGTPPSPDVTAPTGTQDATTATQTAPAPGDATQTAPTDTTGTPSDTMTSPAPPAPPSPPAAGASDTGSVATPVGGYQPSGPATSGPVAPGAQVRFQAAQSPDQAYPAPAPLAKYPVCKKGQYDKCIQRGGR